MRNQLPEQFLHGTCSVILSLPLSGKGCTYDKKQHARVIIQDSAPHSSRAFNKSALCDSRTDVILYAQLKSPVHERFNLGTPTFPFPGYVHP